MKDEARKASLHPDISLDSFCLELTLKSILTYEVFSYCSLSNRTKVHVTLHGCGAVCQSSADAVTKLGPL